MSEKSAKSFLSLLQRSGIVEQDLLKASLNELSKKAAGRKVSMRELSDHLVESGLITAWHSEKLLAGKYKGYFLGKYKLLGLLGTGGMSSVYLGEHKITGHKRAIKVLPKKKADDKSYLDRFYREGRAAASMNDPNVVRIYDICGEGDVHYMVMEYVKGKDLFEVVRDQGPLDYDLALEYITQAAYGLQHAHDMKLVHRDVKPANLLLTHDGVVKILDLGLALLTDDEESLTVLHNERVMGTADYLAPEQAVNSHEVDHRVDIYGLGCTLYFLLTGHPPFPKGSLAQRIAMHQNTEPAEITADRPDCPREIVALCKTMMKKSADDRFQTCDQVAHAIIACRENVAASATVAQQVPIAVPSATEPVKTNSQSTSSSRTERSEAKVQTDEIASDTLDFGKENSSAGLPAVKVAVAEPVPTKSPTARIKVREVSPKKKQMAMIWFGVMIALMFILLITVVYVAMQFAVLDDAGFGDSLPQIVKNHHHDLGSFIQSFT